MSDDSETNRWWMAVIAVVVMIGAGYVIYRQSQPNVGNLPPLNMSREELMRGAMIDGPGNAAAAGADPNEPTTKTPRKGGSTGP